ncbi:MAG TPA: FAD-dependent oxidoreductase [Casimicrobiaceae bacterium]|nr:FAD-dependent oxidoreductase [Casimicrobiaceae bacterium]
MPTQHPLHHRYDVVIIGGGIMGCSTAYFVKARAHGADICVIEPDPTYELASTLRASGGARVLFSCPENIEMSKWSIEFIRRFEATMAVGERHAPVGWVEGGYLFIVPPAGMSMLEANYEKQRRHGCVVELLSPTQLKERFPSMRIDDLGGGVHSPRDGWCDPNGLLQGFRRKAQSLGVVFVQDRVTEIDIADTTVRTVRLNDGDSLGGSIFVNAAGAWAAEICKMAHMPLPVSPLRRFEHYFTCGNPLERLPYVKDLDRLAFRSEGKGYSGGLVDGNEQRGFNFDVDHGYFERAVWPALAHRFPPLESARCHRTWSGLYEQCELDGNPIIGNWRGHLENFFVIAGFSGHGMMHAPAAGRGLAELIVDGTFQTLDLSRLDYSRIERAEPYAERGIL